MTGLFVSRKVSAEKKKDGDLESRQRHGSENQGYIPEELGNTEQIPSESKLVNHIVKLLLNIGILDNMSSNYITRFHNVL